MIIRSSSLFGLDQRAMICLIGAIALTLVPASNSAPMYESDQTELENYGESTGCYYNYNHYGEGDRIMTNEPCLNCTCHDRMLMCYLRVCPFTKAIGQDCTIEKREDQCCPVITCPEVEVQLLDHQTTASPSNALGAASSGEVGAPDQYGCSISGRFYPEGAQVPSNPQKPCELCYCIRNMTTCVMQECTLHIDGCQPIYNKGVCCPVKYDCDHDKDSTPMLEDEGTTTVRPTPGFILTTTVSPSVSTDCVHSGETYADGALITTDKPCEHCYCMRGDIVCAVQECGTPLENEGKNCTALPPAAGQCCPDKYICDGSAAAMMVTTVASISPAADENDLQEQEHEQPQYEDSQPSKTEQESEAAQTTEASVESTSAPTTDQKVQDVVTAEKEDEEDDQQEQEHVAPQFEDVPSDDGHEEDDSDVQVPEKVDDDEQRLTTPHPTVSEEPGAESDHIPGHEGSHEEDEDRQQEATTAVAFDDVPALTTVRAEVQSNTEQAAQDETSTETHDDSEEPSDIAGTTVAPTKDAQEPAADDVPVEHDADEATSTEKPTADESGPSYEPTTVRNEEDSFGPAVTTSLPALANADEKENEIDEHHDQATEPNAVQHQPERDEAVSVEELEESQETGTTTALPEHGEVYSEPEVQTHPPSTPAVVPEQDKPDVSSEKKEAAQKADDQPEPEQDFVELPPAVVVTELPPLPTAADETFPAEQTPEPPKDEILENMPLEADSHVLSDSMTTEHAPTFGDRKEDDAQEPEPIHPQPGANLDEPVEMNTVIPLEKDEQKVEEQVNEETETAHDVTHNEPAEEDAPSGEKQDEEQVPVDAETETSATPSSEKLDDDLHVISPDKLFPESIPGEGDCLIDGITYENGATVPTTGKCQVACHCSNSIVHCEMVRCQAPPSDDCTPKATVSGECCPAYSCPKETTSTASSVSVESTEASTESDDVDSEEEQQSADVSAESSESSTKASVSDSQSTSTNEEEDDEASHPSEAESDSAGLDLEDEVFKPLQTQQPPLAVTFDYFGGNRPTTANYDDVIILSTAAPTNVPSSVDTVKEADVPQSTEMQKQEQQMPTETAPAADGVTESEQKEESTTAGAVVERGPEAEQDEIEEPQKQDEESQPTTVKPLAEESQTTNVPISEAEESSSVQSEPIDVDAADDGAEIVDDDQRATTPAADDAEADNAEIQGITTSADNLDKQQDIEILEQKITTASPVQTEQEIERDDEQERPVQTTVRSVEPTAEVTTEHEPEEHQSNEIESDEVSSVVADDDKPVASTDDDSAAAPEVTTTSDTEPAAELETVTETQQKLDDATTVANVNAEQEEDRVQEATTTPAVALSEPEGDEYADVKQTAESDLPEGAATESPVVSTSKPALEVEQTTSFVQDTEAGQRMTTFKEVEQPATTVPSVSDEKESDEPATATVQSAVDDESENNLKTTDVPVTQSTTTATKTSDDALIFRVDDDEEQPIVKPTLEESVPTQGAVKPTLDETKPDQDEVKPLQVDREETDNDNLISPEHDGGFHFPQEDDDEAEEPIFKPTLDDTEQHVALPLPEDIPQEALEPVDQIKEHDEVAQTTTGPSERVTITPTTVTPLQTEQDREQIPHDDDQESNAIEADVQQIAVPVETPEKAPIYDEIEEDEQQTVVPVKPELTTAGHKEQDTELQPTTVKYDVSEDEQEQPTTTTHSSTTFDAVPVVLQQQPDDDDEADKDDAAEAAPESDDTYSTTVRAQDEEANVSTAAPTVAQEQDKPTTPSVPAHDDSQSEEKDETPQIQLADEDEDAPVATTPHVSLKPESADESEQEKEQDAQSDDLDEDEQHEDATAKVTAFNDEVQPTTEVDVKQTSSSVSVEQPTTLAPVREAEQDNEPTQKPDFDDSEESDENAQQQTETTTKVPVAHAVPDTSEELESATEPVTVDVDSSSALTEATLKDSEEDQKLDDDTQDELAPTTVAAPASQDKKQQPEPELDVSTTPKDTEHAAPVEDDVDFEPEQATPAGTAAPETILDEDKSTTAGVPLEDEKPAEPSSTEMEKMTEAPEQEDQVTTVRATEFDFNAGDTYHEHPIFEPESDDDDAQDAIAHTTTFATPEQSNAAQHTPDEAPVVQDAGAVESTDDASTTTYDESAKPEADLHDDLDSQDVRVTTGASIDDEDSAEEDEDVQITTVRQKPISEDEHPSTTTAATVPKEAELDQTSEKIQPPTTSTEEPEQTSESVVAGAPAKDDTVQPSEPTTDKPAAVHDTVEAGTTSEEEQDDVEQPQTDDLHADDDSSEEEDTPITLTTTTAPAKATTTADALTTPTKDTLAEEITSKGEVYTTVVPGSDSQVTEQQTTSQQEDEPVSTAEPVPSTTTTSQQVEDASPTTSTTVLAQETEADHSEAPGVPLEAVTVPPSTSPAATTADATVDVKPEEGTKAPVAEVSQDELTQTTTASAVVQDDDKLDEKIDNAEDKPKPSAPVSDEETTQKPQPASDDSDKEQVAVKPTFTEDEEDDDQQKVQEPEIVGQHDDSSSSSPAKPTQQPETVGPSYGAPGQHYDSGYGHMPPHYPPSSYEDDYGEEEDPAAFGPGTCRYGGKLYVSAQQIPRDDPCDFCFCFRSDIICLQQSCPPPISGCNEEPIAGFCCPRYECPVSMATVLNVTTSTTTTTTTLPPHFLSHAYKGHVQKRGCQIQGKPYNVGETVASASGPCMRCTCGGDGQMQCEPKACSPEPMLQQMIAVAAAKRR
ncbi:mucin-4 [Anopheles maculipalpis]|uniref:mucin-4 n=1 Tax=Anopheles maculipalpis TaxID=1496333 RepID=UPI002158F628|nr:mucin-4 [Anopheles maculipalpis]